MSCKDPEISEQILAWIDGVLPREDSQLFAAHIESCDDCKRDAETLKALTRDVASSFQALRKHPVRDLCPAPEALVDFVGGTTPPNRSAAISVHLEVCAECQAQVATLKEVDAALARRDVLRPMTDAEAAPPVPEALRGAFRQAFKKAKPRPEAIWFSAARWGTRRVLAAVATLAVLFGVTTLFITHPETLGVRPAESELSSTVSSATPPGLSRSAGAQFDKERQPAVPAAAPIGASTGTRLSEVGPVTRDGYSAVPSTGPRRESGAASVTASRPEKELAKADKVSTPLPLPRARFDATHAAAEVSSHPRAESMPPTSPARRSGLKVAEEPELLRREKPAPPASTVAAAPGRSSSPPGQSLAAGREELERTSASHAVNQDQSSHFKTGAGVESPTPFISKETRSVEGLASDKDKTAPRGQAGVNGFLSQLTQRARQRVEEIVGTRDFTVNITIDPSTASRADQVRRIRVEVSVTVDRGGEDTKDAVKRALIRSIPLDLGRGDEVIVYTR